MMPNPDGGAATPAGMETDPRQVTATMAAFAGKFKASRFSTNDSVSWTGVPLRPRNATRTAPLPMSTMS